MSRNDFIEELKKRLRKLPYDEIKEALDYYAEYFDDAGPENEQTVLAELGPPAAIASQIIATSAMREADSGKSAKKSWRSAWLVVLAVFASPIAVPLAIMVGAIAFALVLVMSAIILCFFVAGAALVLGGVAGFIAGLLLITQSFATTLFMVGIGLLFAGIGTAVTLGTITLSKKCFGWLAKLISKIILRRNEE